MRGPEGPVRSTARPRSGLFAPRSGVLSREAALEPEGLIWPRSGPVLCARRGESRAPRIRNTPGTYIYYIILIRFHPRDDDDDHTVFSALQAELFELKGQILPRAVTCSRTAFSKRNNDESRYFPFLVEKRPKKRPNSSQMPLLLKN